MLCITKKMMNSNRKYMRKRGLPRTKFLERITGIIQNSFSKSYKQSLENPLKFRTGFTLVEMLIVSVIISVISLAVYTTFSNGIKIWQKVNTNIQQGDVNIFFEKFSSDLRNTLIFRDIDFLGSAYQTEFPTMVNSTRLNNRTVGQVIYAYNSLSKTLTREERDYSHLYRDDEGLVRPLLENVRFMEFQYYFYDEEKEEYFWQYECASIPLAVKIELQFGENDQITRFIKTIGVPVAS